MEQNDRIQLFEDKRIRTAWDSEKEEWYFFVVDVVGVLTDSVNPAALRGGGFPQFCVSYAFAMPGGVPVNSFMRSRLAAQTKVSPYSSASATAS